MLLVNWIIALFFPPFCCYRNTFPVWRLRRAHAYMWKALKIWNLVKSIHVQEISFHQDTSSWGNRVSLISYPNLVYIIFRKSGYCRKLTGTWLISSCKCANRIKMHGNNWMSSLSRSHTHTHTHTHKVLSHHVIFYVCYKDDAPNTLPLSLGHR